MAKAGLGEEQPKPEGKRKGPMLTDKNTSYMAQNRGKCSCENYLASLMARCDHIRGLGYPNGKSPCGVCFEQWTKARAVDLFLNPMSAFFYPCSACICAICSILQRSVLNVELTFCMILGALS
eukprot:757789-Hanusia_phi.AAC.4